MKVQIHKGKSSSIAPPPPLASGYVVRLGNEAMVLVNSPRLELGR